MIPVISVIPTGQRRPILIPTKTIFSTITMAASFKSGGWLLMLLMVRLHGSGPPHTAVVVMLLPLCLCLRLFLLLQLDPLLFLALFAAASPFEGTDNAVSVCFSLWFCAQLHHLREEKLAEPEEVGSMHVLD
jgi:hypothetical protein